VRPGSPFDDEIEAAIEASLGLLLIFSERCNESEYIRREVTVAGESRKVIFPYRIEDARPTKACVSVSPICNGLTPSFRASEG